MRPRLGLQPGPDWTRWVMDSRVFMLSPSRNAALERTSDGWVPAIACVVEREGEPQSGPKEVRQ